MKYKKGQILYKTNLKTGEVQSLYITDIFYNLSKPIKSRSNFTEEELDNLINEGVLSDDINVVKEKAIRELEEKFNIKLKEV